jgi:hypothetical protein
LASVALLCFSAFTGVALFAWFQQARDDVWTWKALVALVSTLFGVVLSALIWRSPTRVHANLGTAIMLVSLVRIGPPSEWTWRSFSLVALTLILALPLVHASSILARFEAR